MRPSLRAFRAMTVAIAVTALAVACSDATSTISAPSDADVLTAIASLQTAARSDGTTPCPAGGTQTIRSSSGPGVVTHGLRQVASTHTWTWSDCAAEVREQHVVMNGTVVSADTVLIDEARLALVSMVGVQAGTVRMRVGTREEHCGLALRTLQSNGMMRLEGTLCGRRVVALQAVPPTR